MCKRRGIDALSPRDVLPHLRTFSITVLSMTECDATGLLESFTSFLHARSSITEEQEQKHVENVKLLLPDAYHHSFNMKRLRSLADEGIIIVVKDPAGPVLFC